MKRSAIRDMSIRAKTPGFAALHPGYENANKKPAVPQDGGLVSPALIPLLTRPRGR
jgi:hypothetical protein